MAIVTAPIDSTSYAPAIRRIGVSDLRTALSAGFQDFLAIPTQLVFLCIIYPIVGLVAARAVAGSGLLPLLFPLVAGMALLGPVLAVGTYEISRRREAGLPVSWLDAFAVVRSPAISTVALLGVLLLALFTAWIGAARLIFDATIGAYPAGLGTLTTVVFGTAAGWALIVVGNLVGAVFATAVLVLTVVSVPMALDRNVSAGLAVHTSVRAVAANPGPILAWGLVVAVLLVAGSLPIFIGLAAVMPILGHATWHLYRRVVA